MFLKPSGQPDSIGGRGGVLVSAMLYSDTRCFNLRSGVITKGKAGSGGGAFGLSVIPLFRFFVPFIEAHVRAQSRAANHVGIDFNANTFEEISQTDTFDHFTATLMFKRVFGPEVDDFFSHF